MIEGALAGKIDRIVTKSVSRFARKYDGYADDDPQAEGQGRGGILREGERRHAG